MHSWPSPPSSQLVGTYGPPRESAEQALARYEEKEAFAGSRKARAMLASLGQLLMGRPTSGLGQG
jgi:hypothetical protein